MAKYSVNPAGLAHARELIDARRYVVQIKWGDAQPDAETENTYLDKHGWDDYGAWHLALTDGPGEDTKARYAFVFGDFVRLHRMGLVACHYRAAEWGHKEIELAAHELLQYLDDARR